MPINVVKPKFTPNPAISTIYNSVEEWRAEAERRFGSCPSKWTFMCPVCGHVQKVADFQEFKDQGATESYVLVPSRFQSLSSLCVTSRYRSLQDGNHNA